MRKLVSMLSLLLMCTMHLFAQDKTVTGKVTDEKDGSPLPGVSVTVKGTNLGTTTNSDGSFSLSVPATAKTLVFSFVNYNSVEIGIGARSNYSVSLASKDQSLQEVVVVAYGTQRKKDLTGAVTKVGGEKLKDLPVAGPDQALQGQAPGVQVTAQSGTPGGGISIRIRGASSLSAGNQPLWIVDGFPILTGNYQQIGVAGQGLNALSEINPNDIESIEVLKDAAATALYGSRANNGVILVTTKKGRNQKTAITFSAQYGIQRVRKTIEPISGKDYIGMMREGINNRFSSQIPGSFPTLDALILSGLGLRGLSSADSSVAVTNNWQDLVFRDAPMQNYDLSITGGTDKTKFFVSGSYLGQDGIIIGSKFERFNLRTNVENKVNDKLSFGISTALSRSQSNRIVNDNSIFGVFSTAILLGSHIPAYNPNGTYARDPNASIDNPLAVALEPTFLANTTTLLANAFGEYKFTNWLTFKTTVGLNGLALRERQFYPTTTNSGAGTNGNATEVYSSEYSLLNENTLNFRKYLDKKENHNLSILLGNGIQTFDFERVNAAGTNFPGNTIRRLDAASVRTVTGSFGTSNSLVSFFGRVDYAFKGKYLLGLNARRDGSSNFGANNRWGNFYAISAGWNISDEAFFPKNKVVTNLRVRGSWGETGNRNFGDFGSLALIGAGANYNLNSGLFPAQLANPNLSWEKRDAKNIGLELGIFNRISIVAEVYRTITRDLLFNRPLPFNSGYGSIATNIGNILNEGIELSISADVLKSKDFNWNISGNVTWNKNLVTKLSGQPFAAGFASWVQEGFPLGSFRGFVAESIFQTQAEINAAPFQTSNTRPGDIKFADLDKNNTINGDDQQILGNAQPKYYGGFTNTFSWKGLEVSALFQFSQGNMIYNNTRAFAEGMANSVFGQYATILKRWTPQNPHNDIRYPRVMFGDLNNNRRTSTRWLEDGSYLRLRNITVGYNFPTTIAQKLKVSRLRVYVQGQNLITWTKYSGFDPEISTFGETTTAAGTDFLTFPQAKQVSFGLNVTF
jgi:TonB-dependent starch-binding outer membrane protein SusC